jgi:hypothetical protein
LPFSNYDYVELKYCDNAAHIGSQHNDFLNKMINIITMIRSPMKWINKYNKSLSDVTPHNSAATSTWSSSFMLWFTTHKQKPYMWQTDRFWRINIKMSKMENMLWPSHYDQHHLHNNNSHNITTSIKLPSSSLQSSLSLSWLRYLCVENHRIHEIDQVYAAALFCGVTKQNSQLK